MGRTDFGGEDDDVIRLVTFFTPAPARPFHGAARAFLRGHSTQTAKHTRNRDRCYFAAAGTQTASGADNSTPASSVLTFTYCNPAFFPGLAEKVRMY